MPRIAFLTVVLAARVAVADPPRPTLDDFYERTRERDDDFDGNRLAGASVGVETGNPDSQLASGVRATAELGIRDDDRDVARSELWADLLRANGSGAWFSELGWHGTAFAALDHVHLSFDNVLAQRSEITPSDVAELQLGPYQTIDSEAEVAPTGPYVDKDGFLALPIGVQNRLRWTDGMTMERRTAISAALAIRGFPKGIRHHAQLDVLRVKETSWAVAGGAAHAWTLSAGYQRLPLGIDTLPIWALAGYEWAGPRAGAVFQLGGALALGAFEIGPELERHFELDPRTAMFERIDAGGLAVRARAGRFAFGVAFDAVSIGGSGSLLAVTPELAVALGEVRLAARWRLASAADLAFPADRFDVGVDWRL